MSYDQVRIKWGFGEGRSVDLEAPICSYLLRGCLSHRFSQCCTICSDHLDLQTRQQHRPFTPQGKLSDLSSRYSFFSTFDPICPTLGCELIQWDSWTFSDLRPSLKLPLPKTKIGRRLERGGLCTNLGLIGRECGESKIKGAFAEFGTSR